MRSILVWILLVAGSPAAATTAQQFAQAAPPRAGYKTAQLGMTLQEWKALPYPDPAKPNTYSAPICTDNPQWKNMSDPMPVSSIEQQLGVVVCSYYTDTTTKLGLLLGSSTWTSRSFLSLGAEHTMFNVDYAFYNQRLFRIRGSSQARALGDMVDGLTARFGKPANVIETSTQNGVGNTFPKMEYFWNVGQDTILASAPSGKIDQSGVVFLDALADKQLQAAKEKVNPAAGKM